MPKKSDFQQTALSEDKVTASRSNSFNNTISPAQIAQNANLLDIFSFEFKANELPFLLNNAAVNEQKTITTMYTEAEVKEKQICLILNSESAESIIIYQLIQQLGKNVDRPAQTVIVIADEMKKTPNNIFCFTCKDMLSEKYNWIDVAIRGGVCDQTCQYALLILEKVKRETPFDTAYNSAFNKLYHYSYDAKMIFDLAMALINRTTQEDVQQMKKAEYIKYTIKLTGFNYEDEVETYHQITSYIYPTQEAQI
ncbi:hypothetical protein G9A89_018982 [Geosiphon pyriformis]|nr:hypothetical protein G9A89_018982 [Geosiphon pyriformis]